LASGVGTDYPQPSNSPTDSSFVPIPGRRDLQTATRHAARTPGPPRCAGPYRGRWLRQKAMMLVASVMACSASPRVQSRPGKPAAKPFGSRDGIWRASEDCRSCHPLAGALHVDAHVEGSAVAHRGRAVSEDLHLRRVAAFVAHDHGPNPSKRGARTPALRTRPWSCSGHRPAGVAREPPSRYQYVGSMPSLAPAASRHGAGGATQERRPA
jgi:hypothetical protein